MITLQHNQLRLGGGTRSVVLTRDMTQLEVITRRPDPAWSLNVLKLQYQASEK